MRYFITGGAGFIGSNFVDLILGSPDSQSAQVTVFDKLTYAGNLRNLSQWDNDARLNIIIGDICDRTLLAESMINHDVVVNFAAESHVDRSINSADIFIQTNVVGTLNVLESARENGIRTVIQVSTDEVYGSLSEGSATEEFPLLPNSPYAASKAAADLISRSFYKTYGLDVRITRCCNNFGKYQFPEKVIPLFITRCLNHEDLPVYGDGSNVREWIYVDDHCQRILDVIKYGKAGEIYNIGTNDSCSNLELIRRIFDVMPQSDSKIEYVPDRLGHDFRYSLDKSKINSIFNRNMKKMSESLANTIDWYSKNRGHFDYFEK